MNRGNSVNVIVPRNTDNCNNFIGVHIALCRQSFGGLVFLSHPCPSCPFVDFTFMQRLMRLYISVLLLGLICHAPVGFAQETKLPATTDSRFSNGTTSTTATLPTIIERQPGSPSSVVNVLVNGKLHPVLINVSLEQVDAVLKFLSQRSPEPLYSIQSLTAEGQVTDNMAHLTLQLRIQTKNEPIIRIPIGLKSGIFSFETDLNQVVQYDGPAQFGIIANPQGNGYDIVLQAKTVDSSFPPIAPQLAPEVSEPTTTEPAGDVAPVETPAEIPLEPVLLPEPVPLPETAVVPPADQPTALLLDDVPPVDELKTQYVLHTVTLQMEFPVTQPSIGEYQLKAEFPASLSSRVQLVVPQRDAVVMQTKGGNLRQTTLSGEQSTAFVFQGTSSDFEVRWHEKQHTQLRERVVLQVENGRIVAKITSTGVTFDATLPVQSSGGTFDYFSLRLPPGAVFHPTPAMETPDYQIEVVTPEQQDAPVEPSHALSQVLLFRLSQPTEGPVHVRIQAETPINQSQNGWFEVGGLEVIGAEKQFGKLSVIVPQETRLRQKESLGVRPGIDATVTETEGIVYSFEYYEQPCSLLVQAVPQTPRVNLRAEYQVQIQRNRAVLRAKLSYAIHGSQKQVAINMNGWRLTNIEPGSMNNRDEIPFMEDGPVTVPLQEPIGKNVELNLQAERIYNSHDELLRFSFPIPEADFMEPALVAILPDDNIELTVDESHPLVEMSQKSRSDTPLQIELPMRQKGALVYQIDHTEAAEFCAKVAFQQQRITVLSHTELALQSDEPVKQTLDYTVEYEPVSRLILAVPAELDTQGDLRVKFKSLELSLFNVPEMMPFGNTQDTIVLKQVRLPDATIGKFQLALDFKLTNQIRDDLAQERPTSTFQVKVPIILPHDGQLIGETVHVSNPRGLQLNDEEAIGWKKMESPRHQAVSSRSESIYHTETATPLLSLGAAFKNIDRPGTTTIDKGWVRSWLLQSYRVDCAFYQISTNMRHLTIILSDQVHADRIIIKAVKVNDRKVEVERNGRELNIPLFPLSNETSSSVGTSPSYPWLDLTESESLHTVEIWYELPQITSSNIVTLELPSFHPEVIVRPVYCQVILPNSRHLLAGHPAWMPQYRWRFDGGFFSRKPDLTQQELEDWIGVAHAEPISSTLNSYLFITFRPEAEVQLNLVDRSTLILVSSGLILLLGLILIYFPRIRYPGVLFTFLVLFAAVFAYRTSIAILFLQAGIIGFILALIAMFLYRMFVIADPWHGLTSRSLTTVGLKEPSKLVRPEILPDEHHLDDSDNAARVRVVPSDQADSDSHGSGKAPALPMNGEYPVTERTNEDALQQEDSNVTGVPTEQERNDHA